MTQPRPATPTCPTRDDAAFPAGPGTRPARAAWLGRIGYDEARELQARLHAERVADRIPDTLLLLEHDSVYTAGRGANREHFLVEPSRLLLIQTEGAARISGFEPEVVTHGGRQTASCLRYQG